jgi:hypothetical protein
MTLPGHTWDAVDTGQLADPVAQPETNIVRIIVIAVNLIESHFKLCARRLSSTAPVMVN